VSKTVQTGDVSSIVADEVAMAAMHLTKHLRGRLKDASVSVQRGGVVIRGTTNSYYVKQLAQHAVMKRVSLPIAANEIEVHT
jgi:osmotically-inducible protein OsmY